MSREILVPLDLSQPDSIELALPYAVQWARARDASVHLVTVLPDINAGMYPYVAVEATEESRQSAQDRLDEVAAEHIPADLNSATSVLIGRMPRYLIDEINRTHPDMVVMAAHDPGLADIFLGSVSGAVVGHAHCPVLVIRDPELHR
ncbi:universal stress protein [Salinisphaera sp. LB1]|uniref:universal stress protein n=1 Tax=Salinisphaera sp. LB1 TaxID=2183911 RepID=UPI000D7DC43B|nr:universal stress protein [Salinisphaera sp. LB1]AWN17247.1 Universal stress protein family 3 [Salinisphaera sp. LB1]